MLGFARIALAGLAVFALSMFQSGGCGYEPEPSKGEGEACTRTTECQSHLSCRGGVCASTDSELDAGPFIDAGRDAGQRDAGDSDGGELDAGESDAGESDAGELDGGELDGGDGIDPDAGGPG